MKGVGSLPAARRASPKVNQQVCLVPGIAEPRPRLPRGVRAESSPEASAGSTDRA